MNELNITSAQYQQEENTNISIAMQIDGDTTITYCVPLDPANTHYAEIMRQVEAGELTIADAD
jgi:hypothetical protein